MFLFKSTISYGLMLCDFLYIPLCFYLNRGLDKAKKTKSITLHSTMFLFKSVPSNSPHTLPKSTLFCRPLSCFPFIYTYSPLIIHLNTIKSKKKSHHCQPTILLALSHIDNTIKRNLFCPPLFPTFLYPAIFPDGF